MKEKVATIGFFDGVHRGHRFLLSALRELGQEVGASALAVTFDVHPLAIIRPGVQPQLLCAPEERLAMLRSEVEEVLVQPFTAHLARLTAAQFLSELSEKYGVCHLLMGHDHRFGSDGRGMSREDYTALGRQLGITIHHTEREASGASSSAIRGYLKGGNVTLAGHLLGRTYSLSGTIVHGRKVGRTIGFPTANLAVAENRLVPDLGIYVCYAEEGDNKYEAVVSIGQRPTLNNGTDITIEAYLLDFDGDLYGKEMTLRFVRRLRSEMKFNGLPALTEQIAIDCVNARKVFQEL